MRDAEPEHWEPLYRAALLEVDQEKLVPLLRAAEKAIQQRLVELSHSTNHHGERQAIQDALQNLRVLRQTEFLEEQT